MKHKQLSRLFFFDSSGEFLEKHVRLFNNSEFKSQKYILRKILEDILI